MRKALAIAVIAILVLSSCGNDDDNYVYPPVSMEFATITTGIGGNIEILNTDDGKTFLVNQDLTNSILNPGSSYRVVTNYQPLSMPSAGEYGTADIYTLTNVYCTRSIPASSVAGGFETDPVTVNKIWKRGNFVNIELGVMAKDKEHEFRFINEGRNYATNTITIKLMHDNGGDYPAYTKLAYLSLQLNEFKQVRADSVAININTDNGWEQHTFPVD